MNSTNRYLRNLLISLLTAILLAACGTDTANAPEAGIPARPLGPQVAEPPKFTKSTQRGRWSRCRIKPKRTRVQGLPTLSALAGGCSGRFP